MIYKIKEVRLYGKFKFIARIRKCRNTVDIYFIRNSIETLLRAMLYNQTNMQNAVEKAYNSKKIGGENYGR